VASGINPIGTHASARPTVNRFLPVRPVHATILSDKFAMLGSSVHIHAEKAERLWIPACAGMTLYRFIFKMN